MSLRPLHQDQTRMPTSLMIALFNRLALLEDQIADRTSQGKGAPTQRREMAAILWLMYHVGIRYRRPQTLPWEAQRREDLTSQINTAQEQIVEKIEKPLPLDQQREIVAAYRRGTSIEELAAYFDFPRRAICNVLNDAGYSTSVARDEHRQQGIDG
jgi:DNA-directed RNA polymerase specialized sigma24 family protein